MSRIFSVIAATLFLGVGVILQWDAPTSLAQDATPETNPPIVISSEVLGRAVPAAVESQELALARVTIMPGASIPTHHHPGTQIGVVVQGELTYEVLTGEIALYRKDDPSGEPYKIQPGETVVVRPGDALVESPGSLHHATNAGDVPIVIYLSTLFPAGAPRSIMAEATPVP